MSDKNLFVIGGPNGAGKSTSSQAILSKHNLVAFDWDQVFDNYWNKFNYDPALIEGIRNKTNSDFSQYIESSFEKEMGIAFETNFHTSFSIEICRRAKKSGYQTNLIFLLVQSIDICIERVEQRVKNGGHHVSKSEIKDRYRKGLIRLNDAILTFDSIILLDTTESYTIRNIANIQNGKPIKTYSRVPDSMEKLIPNISKMVNR